MLANRFPCTENNIIYKKCWGFSAYSNGTNASSNKLSCSGEVALKHTGPLFKGNPKETQKYKCTKHKVNLIVLNMSHKNIKSFFRGKENPTLSGPRKIRKGLKWTQKRSYIKLIQLILCSFGFMIKHFSTKQM